MGYFARIPEGRAYLVEVPGVSTSPLTDDEIARVLNWMLLTFSSAQLPQHFVPYSAEEIRKCRVHKLIDVSAARRRLAAKLKSMGFRVAEDHDDKIEIKQQAVVGSGK
jgi:hypothetical protein